jgi:hypothetical protein
MSLRTMTQRGGTVGPTAHYPVGANLDGDAAQALLVDLGFLLVPGPPLDRGAAYLMVALRPHPTKAHFDPERIEYWTLDEGRAQPTELTWPMSVAGPRYSWGAIRIIDRIAATNTFASFGGNVTVSRDLDVQAVLFRSEAPILSLGGHSGPADPLGANVGGFFAVLRAAAGHEPVKHLADSLSPAALYSAFVARTLETFRNPEAAATVSPHLVSVFRSEQCRLRTELAADEAAGRDLAAKLQAKWMTGEETT